MNKLHSALLLLGGSACALAATVGAVPAVVYDVPVGWIRVEGSQDQEVYQTSFDPSSRLYVRIRVTDTGGMGAEKWAIEEAAAMADERGVRVGSLRGETIRGTRWAYLDWHDPKLDERGRQYYLEAGPSSLISVGISARSEVFLAADASQFDDFFASFQAKEEGA